MEGLVFGILRYVNNSDEYTACLMNLFNTGLRKLCEV